MKKKVLVLMAATMLAKIGGFIRDIILSYYYGASVNTDAYFISLTIPNLILDLISVGINTGYIPMYSAIEKENGAESSARFTNYLVNLVLIICTLLFILAFIFTAPIVRLFTIGFDAKSFELAVMLTRISITKILFLGTFHVFRSYLQIKNSYFIPGMIGLPMNILVILAIIISVKTNMVVLAAGTAAASLLEITVVFLLAQKIGHKYKPELDIKSKDLSRMAGLILPAVIGTSAGEINKVADKTIASSIAEGGISSLNYAHKIDAFIIGLFVNSVSSVTYPKVAKKAAEKDMDGLKSAMLEAIGLISLIVIPATIGTVVFSQPLVELLFSRGAFDAKAAVMTSNALLFYSLGILPSGIRSTLVRVFYSLHDSKTPVLNSFIAMTANVILNLILSRFLGIGGLALASSIAAFISMSLMVSRLRKKIGPLGMKNYIAAVLKITLISIGMGMIARLVFDRLNIYINRNLSLMVSILIGTAVFFTAAYFAKINTVDSISAAVKRKLIGYVKRYQTDFAKDSIGRIPSGWSVRWSREAECCIVEGDESGKRLLRVDAGNNVFNNKLITWDTPGSAANVRVKARVKNREANEYQAWLVIRAGGTSSEPTGYALAMGAGKLEIISFMNGCYQFHTGKPFDWKAGNWYWLDIKAAGNSIQAKAWEDDTAEPEAFQLSIKDSRIQHEGRVGFGGMAPGYHDCDAFEVYLL